MTSLREQLRGFPVFQLVVVNIMRFGEPLSFSSLFPYVYYMIRDFKIAETEEEISKYSGYLAACFSFTQFLFSVYWGKLSDRIGRKKVVTIGLFGTSISMLIFGFAPNYYVALAARSFLGAVNGNVAVVRTIIAELTTDRKHQAIAFSTFPLLWNIGSIIGPLIGGSKYFTRPKEHNPYEDDSVVVLSGFKDFHEWFLNKYPYASSNIIIALFLWTGALVGFLFLEETHYKRKKDRDLGLDMGDWILNKLGYKTPARPWKKNSRTEETALLNDIESISSDDESFVNTSQPQQIYAGDNESINSSESIGPIGRRMSKSIVRRYSSLSLSEGRQLRSTISRISGVSLNVQETRDLENSTWGDIFTDGVVQTIFASFILAFHNVVYNEFLPVFLASQLMVDRLKFPWKIAGGFGYDSDSIGSLISVTGLTGVLVVIIIFPYLDRNFKTVNNYRVALLGFPLLYFFMPWLIFTLHEYNPSFSPNTTKYLLYFNGMCYQLASATSFPQVLLLIHRAAPAKHRAFINGSALSVNALARFIAPVTWGYLMTYFDIKGHSGFTWYILSFISVLAVIQSWFLKDYNEDMK
ncbi:uncharacterized membrane protein [[Candida] jaroonii]|uniref:Uncharacterized membrane protein n=1 Tax=[Candida] jaroonii TaxID=467808 RepID=A0ACA9Y6I3_9ASCO|nr:uncharacterized membrane protein [[Candida] jaroonii]